MLLQSVPALLLEITMEMGAMSSGICMTMDLI